MYISKILVYISKKSGVSTEFKNWAGDELKFPKRESPAGIGRVGMFAVYNISQKSPCKMFSIIL